MRLRGFVLVIAFIAILACGCVFAEGEAFSISPGRGEIGVGEMYALTVEGGTGAVKFTSSDESVLTVSSEGAVKGVKVGEAMVTATDYAGARAQCVIAVKKAPASASLKGNPAAIGLGESFQLNCLLPEGSAGGVEWSVKNAKVVSIDENGVATGVNTGYTYVYAVTYNGKRAEWKLTVAKGPTSFALNVREAALGVGQSGVLTPKVNKGAPLTASYYSTNPEIAAVDAYGRVTGIKPGEANIIARTYNGLSDTCKVTVYPAPESVRVIAERPLMGAGESFMAACEFTPADALSKVTYSTNNTAVLNVNAEGKVIARKAGRATIIATLENGVTGEVEVEVRARPTSVRLTAPHNPMGEGESMRLNVSYNKGAYGYVTFQSRNKKVATVDGSGLVTAVARGKATIDVRTYNGCSYALTIYVQQAPGGVKLAETDVVLGAGETRAIAAAITSGAGGFSFRSLNEDICAVTSDGVLTGIAPGDARIVCETYNGFSDVCTVHVYAAPVAISAAIPNAVLGAGESAQIVAALTPLASKAGILYASSNAKVATVSATGLVTAKAAGECVIAVYAYNGVGKEIPIRVMNAPKAISINVERPQMAVGDTCSMTYALDKGAGGQVNLTCDAPGVLGYKDGVLSALAPGVARVKATAYNGVSAIVEVTVKALPEWIAFGAPEYWLKAGQIATADIRVPKDAYTEVRYECSDENVCVFLGDGSLLALKEGEADITAYTQVEGVQAVTRVMVLANAQNGVIDLRNTKISAEEAASLQRRYPDMRFLWEFTVLGKKILSTDTRLDLTKKGLNNVNDIRRLLNALPNITYLDLSYNDFSYETLAQLREEYRGRVKIVWTVDIYRWSIRTDDTGFSTLLDDYSLRHTSKEFEPLKYCEDMMALDLGHNVIRDMNFLLGMPKLKILILSVNGLSDITLLGELKELEYLELFTNEIVDISAIAKLENLLDLNLSNNKVDDITPLLELPKLERLWMTHNKVSAKEIEQLKQAHPNCEMNFDAPGPDRRGWRSHYRYFVIYQIFHTNVYVPWDAKVAEPPNWRAYY